VFVTQLPAPRSTPTTSSPCAPCTWRHPGMGATAIPSSTRARLTTKVPLRPRGRSWPGRVLRVPPC